MIFILKISEVFDPHKGRCGCVPVPEMNLGIAPANDPARPIGFNFPIFNDFFTGGNLVEMPPVKGEV